jgi:hypothetical protein
LFFFFPVIWIVVDAAGGGELLIFYDYFDGFCSDELEFEFVAGTDELELL